MTTSEIKLVYDRECPACDFYCRRAEVADSAGRLALVDARHASAIMDEITRAGFDIDRGMVLKKDGVLYYAADAIHQLALLTPRRGAFNRLNRLMFVTRRGACTLYPALRACRKLLLKALGKTKINNLRILGNDRF